MKSTKRKRARGDTLTPLAGFVKASFDGRDR